VLYREGSVVKGGECCVGRGVLYREGVLYRKGVLYREGRVV